MTTLSLPSPPPQPDAGQGAMPHDHELKAWPDPFRAMITGKKLFEFRKDDRGFNVGDVLWIREWDPNIEKYLGRSMTVQVSYILRGRHGVPDGFCVMSFDMGDLVPRAPAPHKDEAVRNGP